MGKLKVAGLMTLILALCPVSLSGKHQEKPKKKLFVDYQQGFSREAELRHDALITALPIYPDEAVEANVQGLAMVAVLFDENGDFMNMKVLESPHPAISKAVRDALKEWKIKIYYDSPYPESRLPVRVCAQVQFHFVIRDGVPFVEPATREEQMSESQKFLRMTSSGIDGTGW